MSIITYLLAFIPQQLPTSRSELDQFTNDVLDLGGWEHSGANRAAIARVILELPMYSKQGVPQLRLSKRYFYLLLKRSLSNEAAFGILDEQRKNAQPVKASNDTEAVESIKSEVGN